MIRPYPSYKASGVEWIAKIPSHWKTSKLKYDTLYPVRYGMNISSDKYTATGIRFIRVTDLTNWGNLKKSNGKYLNKDEVKDEFLLNKYDLLFCRSGSVGKAYFHLEGKSYTSGGYLVRFNFGNYSKSKFVFYISKTGFYWHWIHSNAITSTIENVNGEKYSNMLYLKPTDEEQIQIIEYLDIKTRKINELLKKSELKVALLKEKRVALINHCVTKGLKINSEMKASGIKWIEYIPAHWKSAKIKYFYDVVLGKMVQNKQKNDDEVLTLYLKAVNVQWGSTNFENIEQMWANPSQIIKFGIKEGDLLVCEGGESGRSSIVKNLKLKKPVIIQNALHRVRPANYLSNVLLLFLMKTISYSGWFNALCNKATIQHLTWEKVINLKIPVPPPKEHNYIIKHLNKQTQKIDSIIKKEARRIELLKEYRQSLISEVVTGKIDVRDWKG